MIQWKQQQNKTTQQIQFSVAEIYFRKLTKTLGLRVIPETKSSYGE